MRPLMLLMLWNAFDALKFVTPQILLAAFFSKGSLNLVVWISVAQIASIEARQATACHDALRSHVQLIESIPEYSPQGLAS